MGDLTSSTVPSKVMAANTRLNPLTQATYIKISRLEPRVREAIRTGRKYGLFPLTNLPSPNTGLDMLIYKHPYLGPRATDGLWCMAEKHGMTTVRQMPKSGPMIDKCISCAKKNMTVQSMLKKIRWYQPLAAAGELPLKPLCAAKPSLIMNSFRQPYLTLPGSDGVWRKGVYWVC
jgi:hypothetical protein